MCTKNKNHKKPSQFLVTLSLATVLSVFADEAQAQNLNCIEPLVFGEIIPCGAAGTVTVRPDNSVTQSCVTLGGSPTSRARCTVTQSFPFRPIQLNVTTPVVNISNGGNNMSVTNFNVLTNSGGTQATITAPFADFPIGATVNVGATQADGSYTGTFGVTAILQ